MTQNDPFGKFYDHLDGALLANQEFVDEFKSYARIISVQKGDYLLRVGEVCTEGYFINKGLCCCYWLPVVVITFIIRNNRWVK